MTTLTKNAATNRPTKMMAQMPKMNLTGAAQTQKTILDKRVCIDSKPMNCPRCEHDVYAFAMRIQYYIGSLFLELADRNKSCKAAYTSRAAAQLTMKDKIAGYSNERLNDLLRIFYYVNEGQVIPPPVSETMAETIQPDFDAKLTSFIKQLDEIVAAASIGKLTVEEAENQINAGVIEMYSQLKAVYQAEEIQTAIEEMIRIKQ